MSAPAPAPLPAAQRQLLGKAQRMVDRKNYKQALKYLDQVLKKFPRHGEATLFRGVVLMYQAEGDEARKGEAMQLMQHGLKLDESCVASWKWTGHMLKYLKRYEEALPYLERYVAMEPDPDMKAQFLREIAALQMQRRKLAEYVATRKRLAVEFKKNQDTAYVGMAVGSGLLGNVPQALAILDQLKPKLQMRFTVEPEVRVEFGMYRAMLLNEHGDPAAAAKFLSVFFPKAVPPEDLVKLGLTTDAKALPVNWARPAVVRERLAEYQLRASLFDAAKDEFYALLLENPENVDFHRGFQSALVSSSRFHTSGMDLPSNDPATALLLTTYTTLLSTVDELKSSLVTARIHIETLSLLPERHAEFVAALDAFLRKYWARGLPGLFTCMKPLLVLQPGLGKTFADLAQAREQELRGKDVAEAKDELSWVLFFRARLVDHDNPGHDDALALLDQALDLQPDASERADFTRFKARVLKHSGDLARAADTMDAARKLDLNDRYMNNKCVKYLIRAERLSQAMTTANLFFRDEHKSDRPDPAVLHDSQCAWFENELGETAAARHREHTDVIEAYKAFSWVRKHYAQYEDDQMDFHDYALRKVALLAYHTFTRFSDVVHRAPAFRRAARGAVGVLLRVADSGEGVPGLAVLAAAANKAPLPPAAPKEKEKEPLVVEDEDESESAPQQQQQAQQQPAEDATPSFAVNQKPTSRSDIAVDSDPKGVRLFQTASKDPLREAKEWTTLLTKQAGKFVESHQLAFDVAARLHDFAGCVLALDFMVRLVGAEAVASGKAGGVLERLVPMLRFHGLGSCAAYPPWSKRAGGEFVMDKALGDRLGDLGAKVFGSGSPLDVCQQLLQAEDETVVVSAATALLRASPSGSPQSLAALQALLGVRKSLALVRRVRDVLCECGQQASLAEHKSAVLKVWPKAVLRDAGPCV